MDAAGSDRSEAGGSPLPRMPEVDPFGAERSVATASDASQALVILARELYWAGDPISRTPTDAGSVRERLHTFSHRLRVEAREMYPSSETSLDRSPRLRRRVKRRLWFGIRFATLRYDRLLAELAELNAQLADRVATLERELERRGDRDDARDEP